jgi:hypothetical protein
MAYDDGPNEALLEVEYELDEIDKLVAEEVLLAYGQACIRHKLAEFEQFLVDLFVFGLLRHDGVALCETTVQLQFFLYRDLAPS